MKSKYRTRVCNENLVSKLRCAINITYTTVFEDSEFFLESEIYNWLVYINDMSK